MVIDDVAAKLVCVPQPKWRGRGLNGDCTFAVRTPANAWMANKHTAICKRKRTESVYLSDITALERSIHYVVDGACNI